MVDNEGHEIFADKVGVMLARDLSARHPNARVRRRREIDRPVHDRSGAGGQRRAHALLEDRPLLHEALHLRAEGAGRLREVGPLLLPAAAGQGLRRRLRRGDRRCDMLDRNPGKSLADLKNALPKTWGSPTMSPHCADEVKYGIVDKITAQYKDAAATGKPVAGQKIRDLVTVNGVRVVLEDGTWGLVRASSNKPELVIVVESPTAEANMRAIFADIDGRLGKVPRGRRIQPEDLSRSPAHGHHASPEPVEARAAHSLCASTPRNKCEVSQVQRVRGQACSGYAVGLCIAHGRWFHCASHCRARPSHRAAARWLRERSLWRGHVADRACLGRDPWLDRAGRVVPQSADLCRLPCVLIGSRQLGLAILMHDGAHGCLSRNAERNMALSQWLCAYPIFAETRRLSPLSPAAPRPHAAGGRSRPRAVGAVPDHQASYRRKFWRDITGQTGYEQRKAQLLNALGDPSWPLGGALRHFGEQARAAVRRQRLLFAGLALAGVWWAYPLLWLVPLLTWMMVITRIRNIAEHAVVPDADDPLRNTRTTQANRLERAFVAPYFVNYHLEHHLFFYVPCYNLPKLHRILSGGRTDRMEMHRVIAASCARPPARPMTRIGPARSCTACAGSPKPTETPPRRGSDLVLYPSSGGAQTMRSAYAAAIVASSRTAAAKALVSGMTGGTGYFAAAAPAMATCASCSDVTPDTPTAPTILPSAMTGTPPSSRNAPRTESSRRPAPPPATTSCSALVGRRKSSAV